MNKNIWNVLTATLITSLVAIMGYLFSAISEIQRRDAAQEAVVFTVKDATQLQQKLTDVMTDIDMRLSLIERDIQWIKMTQTQPHIQAVPVPVPEPPKPTEDPGIDPDPGDTATGPPSTAPTGDTDPFGGNARIRLPNAQSPRYDLRRQQEQSRRPDK